MANTFDFLEIKFKELSDNVKTYIKDLYNKSNTTFSPASPYWNIMEVILKIHEKSMLYLKNSLSIFDLNNPDNKSSKITRTWARVAGHNPSRNLSATGTIYLKLKPSSDISDIGRGEIVIPNKTQLLCVANSLNYFIDLGGNDSLVYKAEQGKKIILTAVEGVRQSQVFTGSGNLSQSFSLALPQGKTTEQYRTQVKVNGEYWERVEHLTDMYQGQKAWYSRTGIESSEDVFFGTDDFGAIPPKGSRIEVEYIISNGSLGNIPSIYPNILKVTGDIYDGNGQVIETDTLFDIFIEDEISMGADSESVEFTKRLLPFASRNFVLARPEQFIFMLRRLNIFSQVDAFTTEKGSELDNSDPYDDSVVYIMAVPDIEQYITGSNSYFTLDLNAFYLGEKEKIKIEKYIKSQGIMTTGTSLKILDPVIRKYAVNIYLRIFEDSVEENIRTEIINGLGTYFTTLERRGRIDKSSAIKLIEEVEGVDSVMVEFISESNESYHRNFELYKESILKENPLEDPDDIIMDGYEKDNVIGLDPLLGDIVYNKDEIPVIRGGWYTRNNIFVKETPTNGFSSVNIKIQGISKKRIF